MPFDFNVWKIAMLRGADDAIDQFDILVASGLVEDDDLEVAFEKLLNELENEIAEQKRQAGDDKGERRG